MTRKALLEWRRARGWTQREAAEWYGCSSRAWQRYESGEAAVPEPLAKRIADPIPAWLTKK